MQQAHAHTLDTHTTAFTYNKKCTAVGQILFLC